MKRGSTKERADFEVFGVIVTNPTFLRAGLSFSEGCCDVYSVALLYVKESCFDEGFGENHEIGHARGTRTCLH